MNDYIIGLDFDGVCYDFDSTARWMLRNRIHDTGRAVPEMLFRPAHDWNETERYVNPGDWKWLWTDGIKDGLFRYGHIIEGAIWGVQRLNEMGDVMGITTRPKTALHDTLVWVSAMFDKAPLSALEILSYGQKKSQVFPRPNVYIDDAEHNADDILENTGASVVLFDQPWNYHYPDISVRHVRAKGWREVVAAVAQIKEAGKWQNTNRELANQ